MALAILELLAVEKAYVRFNIDTGTNKYYQLKIGRNVRRKYGIDWVDEVVSSTPVGINEAGGNVLHSSKDVSIPVTRFDKGNAYVQLFSFKTAEGKSPAFSRVVRVPMGFGVPAGIPTGFAPFFAMATSMKTTYAFQPPRRIPCQSYTEAYARQASLEDLLAGIVKMAAPAVLNLLGGAQNGARQSASSGSAGATADTAQANLLTFLLNTILGSVPAMVGQTASQQQSLNGAEVHDNRFLDMQNAPLSRPFIFGIDDALLGTLLGPVVQMLPQLMNAANQRRVQMKQADNKLITDILSDVNRRLLLEQLLQAQRQAPQGGQPGNAADLNQLLQLLQQAPATPQQGVAPAASQPPVTPATATQSLSLDVRPASTLSSKAVIAFVTAEPVPWNGMPKVLFAKGQGLQLKLRLNVAEPVPKTPLPKAILKILFKDGASQSVWYEKTFKQKNVLPNSVMALPFLPDELSHLPVNKPIAVLAEMRWLSSKTGREYKALGSSEIVLVNKYFLKEQGKDVSTEQELTDMQRFRPFWNKVWEAPTLDAAGGKRDGEKKYLWELDVSAKYSVLLSAAHETNGLMETKILRGQADEQSLSEKTEGRMKAGIELSIAELNKLVALWDGESALDRDKLEAFQADVFAQNYAGEFIYNFKLKGRAGERGMIWVVPTFKLFDFTLATVQKTDEAGQVMTVVDEKVRFPLPVAARVIGLKSQS
jgi:hypothetical protein